MALSSALKASLMARCNAEDWKHQLPWVLFRLRTAPRADGAPSTTEKTYGESLVVRASLRQRIATTHWSRGFATKSATFTPPGLASTTHVFVRDDAVCPPLTRPYKQGWQYGTVWYGITVWGPFRMLERNNKVFLLALHGRNDWVSIDRVKPALLEEDTEVTALHPPPGQPSPQPGPLKGRAHGLPRKSPPTPAVRHPHTEGVPPMSSHSCGTLQRPSRYAD
ncbi:uncharacterized protein [Macrobrachium rosenbergii]|uniref:uncharacterized protein n=1 Tax=Macrobrachium rosenbergii TaxID=79674 RepID=UPI0034D3FAB5